VDFFDNIPVQIKEREKMPFSAEIIPFTGRADAQAGGRAFQKLSSTKERGFLRQRFFVTQSGEGPARRPDKLGNYHSTFRPVMTRKMMRIIAMTKRM